MDCIRKYVIIFARSDETNRRFINLKEAEQVASARISFRVRKFTLVRKLLKHAVTHNADTSPRIYKVLSRAIYLSERTQEVATAFFLFRFASPSRIPPTLTRERLSCVYEIHYYS